MVMTSHGRKTNKEKLACWQEQDLVCGSRPNFKVRFPETKSTTKVSCHVCYKISRCGAQHLTAPSLQQGTQAAAPSLQRGPGATAPSLQRGPGATAPSLQNNPAACITLDTLCIASL